MTILLNPTIFYMVSLDKRSALEFCSRGRALLQRRRNEKLDSLPFVGTSLAEAPWISTTHNLVND